MDKKRYDLVKMEKRLKKYLDQDRYVHTQGVRFTSAALAMAYGVDLEDAQVAGLLHDCAKCIPNKKKITLCKNNHIQVSEFEIEHPYLLHAKLGAFIARDKYQIQDVEILSAITYHTTGKPGMTLLEKIVFVADYIEPARDKARNLAALRQMAFQDLDTCVYHIMKDTLDYLQANPKDIDQATVEAYHYYRELYQTKKEN